MASGPITSWQIDGETMETVGNFIFWGASKSLQMVTVALKLKDPCSLEEKAEEPEIKVPTSVGSSKKQEKL